MAYYRVKRYNSKRRFRRSYNKRRQFTRFNTYRNRSAKSQAYQIYALNKKVDRLMKYNKPEIQTKSANCLTDTNGASYTTVVNQSTDAKMFVVTPPSIYTTFQGKLCRIKNIKVYGQIHTEYALAYPAVIRLIFFQRKTEDTGFPLNQDIVQYAVGNNSDFERGSLVDGITANYNVLKIKNVLVSPSYLRDKTFKLYLTKLYNFRSEKVFTSIQIKQDTDEQIYPKGTVFCLALFSNPGFKQGSDNAYASLTLKNFMVKVSYVDQN